MTVGVVLNPELRCGIREHTQYYLRHLQTPYEILSQDPDAEDLTELLRTCQDRGLRVLQLGHEFSLFRCWSALTRLLRDARERRIRTVFDVHTGSDDPRLLGALREWCALADRVVVHSPWTEELLKDFCPVHIPLAVADSVLWDTSLDLLVTAKVPLVGTFGFPNPHKGFVEFAQAAGLVERRVPGTHFVIVSNAINDRQQKYLRKVLCLPKHIHCITRYLDIEAVVRTLGVCDVVVLPYRINVKSQSGAVEMAMASGRPLILSESTMFSHIARPAVAGTFPVNASIQEMAEVITSVLRKHSVPGSVREQRKHLVDRRASRIAQLYDELYEELAC